MLNVKLFYHEFLSATNVRTHKLIVFILGMMFDFSNRLDVLQPMVVAIVDRPMVVQVVLLFELIAMLAVVQTLYLMPQLVNLTSDDLLPGALLHVLQQFDV